MLKKLQLASWILPVLATYLPLYANAQSFSTRPGEDINHNPPQRLQPKNVNWEDVRNKNLHFVAGDPLFQIDRVSSLRDISQSDWAYDALQNLANHYGCITGFPDQTYRGEESISRNQFAAALNSCSEKIESAIAKAQPVSTEDIETLLRLIQDFQGELAILRGRVDGSEARTRELELTQFSTTSVLIGETVFGLASDFTETASTVFGDRVRLEFNTSFSGRDLLFTRLATGNFPILNEEISFSGNLSFSQPEEHDIAVEVLYYSFPIGNATVLIGTTGLAADDFADTVSVLDGDGGAGAISTFGTRSPIYQPPGDAGVGLSYNLGALEFSGGYLAGDAAQAGTGLFEAPYSAIAQILLTPIESLDLAFTYVHSRNQSDTETGSTRANIQSLTATNLFPQGIPTVSDSYGIGLSWTISDRVIIGGWGSLSKVTTLSTLDNNFDRGTQDIWQTALTLALPDFGKEGNVAGVIVGIEPMVTASTIDNLPEDEDLSLHLEAFYQYRVNDHLSVTPGVVWITAPDNNSDNEDLVIGTIRTTFSF